jgi:subtilase family serine protease
VENITFTVQVANLGEATAANVVVRLVVDGVQLELQRTIAAAGLSVSAARREGREGDAPLLRLQLRR